MFVCNLEMLVDWTMFTAVIKLSESVVILSMPISIVLHYLQGVPLADYMTICTYLPTVCTCIQYERMCLTLVLPETYTYIQIS